MSDGHVVIICGGRGFDNEPWLFLVLDEAHAGRRITRFVEGGARGADRLARKWAAARGVEVRTFEADWMKHGKAAGPIRNGRMLEEGKPDLVIAFPGGRGTAGMMMQARVRGIVTVVQTESAYSSAVRIGRPVFRMGDRVAMKEDPRRGGEVVAVQHGPAPVRPRCKVRFHGELFTTMVPWEDLSHGT